MKLLILVEAASLRRLIRKIVSGIADEIWEGEGSDKIPPASQNIKLDFVVIDIDSPRETGMSALAKLRTMFPATRIVAITSYDEADLQQSVQAAGADACLSRENLLQLTRLLRWPARKR